MNVLSTASTTPRGLQAAATPAMSTILSIGLVGVSTQTSLVDGRSAAATRGIAVMATLLLVMIGGAWVPSFVFPKWLQQASLAVPTR